MSAARMRIIIFIRALLILAMLFSVFFRYIDINILMYQRINIPICQYQYTDISIYQYINILIPQLH